MFAEKTKIGSYFLLPTFYCILATCYLKKLPTPYFLSDPRMGTSYLTKPSSPDLAVV